MLSGKVGTFCGLTHTNYIIKVSESDIKAEYTMLNKHLRINELLHEYSRWAEITN